MTRDFTLPATTVAWHFQNSENATDGSLFMLFSCYFVDRTSFSD
jgi:hypothetical protein